MPENAPPPAGKWQKRLADYQEKLLQLALLGIPLAVLGKLNEHLTGRIVAQPWQAVWFLVPLAIVAAVLRSGVVKCSELRLNRRFLAFLGAYLLVFLVAAQTSVLDWRRELTVFGRPASRSWLAPVSWGDWRYQVVPKKADVRDELVVVLLEPARGRDLQDARKEVADLIALAQQSQARGVALDFYFDTPSAIDGLLCHAIERARAADVPVFAGYGFERIDGRIAELPTADTLKRCLPASSLGHLAGFLDSDGVARMTPLFFRNDPDRPALSLLVARALAGDASLDLPPDGLVRFVDPAMSHVTVRLAELQQSASSRNLLRGRFVMAGEDSPRDSFETPYGKRAGIAVHATAVHSLRQSHHIRNQPWWLGLAFTLVFCYWAAAWCAAGASALKLTLLAAGATVCLAAVSVAGLATGPYWFDIVYPVAAVWLLLPVLIGVRRALSAARKPAPEPASVAPASPV